MDVRTIVQRITATIFLIFVACCLYVALGALCDAVNGIR